MSDIEPTVRCFVAIELSEEMLTALTATQDKLRSRLGRAAGAVRWVRPEGVHITLEFLGGVAAEKIESIEQALRSCAGAKPFTLRSGSIGVFPNLRRPRVIWVGLEGQLDALQSAANCVQEALKPLGFKPDKAFSPHMTLGRVRETARPDELSAIADAVTHAERLVSQAHFEVEGISLMQSRLQPGGSVYTQLDYVQFT